MRYVKPIRNQFLFQRLWNFILRMQKKECLSKSMRFIMRSRFSKSSTENIYIHDRIVSRTKVM